jgi:threonine dehydrogenase-like Zn-dependent dehydrogenase
MMRTAIFRGAGQPIEISSIVDPRPGDGEIVVKVGRCGICATDISMTGAGPIQYEIGASLGHEFSGEIVEIGPGTSGLKAGARIVALPVAGCGKCENCLAGRPFGCAAMKPMMGGFGHYTVARADMCFTLPSDLSFADGAIVEPLAVGLHSIRLAPKIKGASILVIGGGPIALATAFWARRYGAASVALTTRSDRNRAIAEHMGVTRFIQGEPPRDIPQGDYVFECSGGPGMIEFAIDLAMPRGTIIISGLCMEPDVIFPAKGIFKELSILASLGYTLDDFSTALNALAVGAVEPRAMVTTTVGLDELPECFEHMRAGRSGCKILVDPWANS